MGCAPHIGPMKRSWGHPSSGKNVPGKRNGKFYALLSTSPWDRALVSVARLGPPYPPGSQPDICPTSTSFLPSFLPFFFFLRPHLWHMEVPRLGAESELQLQAYARPQQYWIRATAATYATNCSHTGSLTWGQGSNLHPHRHYARSLTCWATVATLIYLIFNGHLDLRAGLDVLFLVFVNLSHPGLMDWISASGLL